MTLKNLRDYGIDGLNKMKDDYGMGMLEWLFLLFLGLKLGGVIDWSWWYITLPITIGVVAGVIIFLSQKNKPKDALDFVEEFKNENI